jgi:hypothetical protein
VFVHGVRRPGDVYQGYGPKTGCPRDAEGRMILVHRYGPPRSDLRPVDTPVPETPPKVRRGVAVEQETLL